MDDVPKNRRAKALGLAALIGGAPSIYAFNWAYNFFYTRKEAIAEFRSINESIYDIKKENIDLKKDIYFELKEINNKVSRIQGRLEQTITELKSPHKADDKISLEEDIIKNNGG